MLKLLPYSKGKCLDETFDSDLPRERQRVSVPNFLWQLVQLIIEGPIRESSVSTIVARIATNISQTIRYNLIKYQRSECKIWSVKASQQHPLSNEPPFSITVGLMAYMKTRNKSIVNQLACEGLSVDYQRVQKIQKVICKKF